MPTMPTPLPASIEALEADDDLWAVVFAGGIGSRFWPLSSPTRPKAVLHLLGERPLIADTIHRIDPLIPMGRVLVMTSHDIAPAVCAAVPSVPPENILTEPRPLGTAAALAWALHVIIDRAGPSALVCALHADLAAAFPGEFRDGLERAAALASRERLIVTLGVAPTRLETSFGYAVPGEAFDSSVPVEAGGACRIMRFVEKPGVEAIAQLVGDGALWHAGVVVARAGDLRDELLRHTREISAGYQALTHGNLTAFASLVRSISVERGLLERCDRLAVVPIDCGWDDVGTWAALRRARELDDEGNGAIGQAVFVDSNSNVVHSEAGAVVLFGCQRLLVVTLPGLTFVTPLEKAADLKPLLDQLPANLRSDPLRPSP